MFAFGVFLLNSLYYFQFSVTFWLILEKMIILVKIPGKENLSKMLLWSYWTETSWQKVLLQYVKDVKKTLHHLLILRFHVKGKIMCSLAWLKIS